MGDPKGFTPGEIAQIKEAAKKMEQQKEEWKKDKIEVFEQLLTLPAFIEWSKDNLIINREVNHLQREILISVIYKGDYQGNKTSLQKLAEIDAIHGLADTDSQRKLDMIKEVLDYAPETQEPEDKEATPDADTN
jgi:hypothetical protein